MARPALASQKSWLARWRRRFIGVRERTTDLWADREAFREFRHVISSNKDLPPCEFFNFVHRSYFSHLLVGIRALSDKGRYKGTPSNTLHNLIDEIKENSQLLTRSWFVERWKQKHRTIGEEQFERRWGLLAYVDPSRVQMDNKSLVRLCARIKVVVDKQVAHNDSRKPPFIKRLTVDDTIAEVDKAIDGVFTLVGDYNSLLFNKYWCEPTVLSSARVFRVPWLTNR